MTKYKTIFLISVGLFAINASAQDTSILNFDLTKPQPVYNQTIGYGYDLQTAPDKQNPAAPFYFSVKVPDGNYRVKVVLGGKKNSNNNPG
jgi:hypothetical protein